MIPRHGALILGGILILLIAGAALLSLVWTPHVATEISVSARFRPISWENWLGTDQYGRDIFSLLMVGAQSSMIVALLSVGAGGLLGIAAGLLASAYGNWIEELIMRLADFSFAFPALLFAIMLASIYGPSLTNAVVAIAFINLPFFARITRAAANSIWQRDYVTAARAAGHGRFYITRHHVLPNITAELVVQATIQFALAILIEAALSYLGIGIQPPTPSWGRMLAEAQTMLFRAPELAIYPGLAIVIAVLGFNLLGDGIRDITDPRLKRRRA